MAVSDRTYIALRGDEERPFVKVTVKLSSDGPMGTVSWAGSTPPADGLTWPQTDEVGGILDWAFNLSVTRPIALRVVLEGADWNDAWGRLLE